MVGQRRAAARAVRADPVVTDQQALVEDVLERPPDRLDVVGVHRPVRLGQVDPVAHPLGQVGEGVHVPEHRLAAARVELGDAVGLDVLLAGDAQLALDGHLDRQAVAVPAGLARYVEALHGLETGEDVLEDAGLDVVHAGHAVGGRRPLVEGPGQAALGLLQRLREDVGIMPADQHLALDRGQVDLGRQGGEAWRAAVGYLRHDGAASSNRNVAGGTSPPCGVPAVPPSLAAAGAGRSRDRETPAGVRPSRGSLRPVLLGVAPLTLIVRKRDLGVHAQAAAGGRSSGGSGVIWSAGPASGLAPSPDRSWPLSASAVPINTVQASRISDPARRPERITGEQARMPVCTAPGALREGTANLFAEKRDVTYSPLTVHIHDHL